MKYLGLLHQISCIILILVLAGNLIVGTFKNIFLLFLEVDCDVQEFLQQMLTVVAVQGNTSWVGRTVSVHENDSSLATSIDTWNFNALENNNGLLIFFVVHPS